MDPQKMILGKKVLIVDDEKDILDVLTELLELCNFPLRDNLTRGEDFFIPRVVGLFKEQNYDGILLVVKYRSTPRKLVTELTETLGKEKILGVVFNMCDFEFASYNYSKYGKYSEYYESGREK